MSLKELKFVAYVKLYKYFTTLFELFRGRILFTWNIHSKILNENQYRFFNENNDNETDLIFNLVIPSNRFQD